ncbi:MAG: hypothetical protein NTZ19_01755 [Bacteroidetes bacterium]|nr:hypothetical protein [Bacteroidota bacterium]
MAAQKFSWVGLKWLTLLLLCFSLSSCFKQLPNKYEVYFNDFEGGKTDNLTLVDRFGIVDSFKIAAFNNGHVYGFFNNNRIELRVNNMPSHNAIKIEFDLLIHDKWDGDYLIPNGSGVPDAWQMILDNQRIYITTFSNGSHGQSFPYNYINASTPSNPARGDAWDPNLPGVNSLKSQSNGSTLYKIEYTTAHTESSVYLACNDALQPYKDYFAKSWSIDNLRVTAIYYR